MTVPSKKIGPGDLGLGADVSFGAGVKAKAGDTWKFDSMEEWESMREQLDDGRYEKIRKKMMEPEYEFHPEPDVQTAG